MGQCAEALRPMPPPFETNQPIQSTLADLSNEEDDPPKGSDVFNTRYVLEIAVFYSSLTSC